MGTDEMRSQRYSGALGTWEVHTAPPRRALRRHVVRYFGYTENTTFTVRREPPPIAVPFIINLGPPLRIAGQRHDSGFLAGMSDAAGLVESTGEQSGIQVDFTPIGAELLLGHPIGDMVRQVVPLPELLGPAGENLVHRLHAEPLWHKRFQLVDNFITARFAVAGDLPADLVRGWQLITTTGGTVPVHHIAAELGCSPKHLRARFVDHFGLPPKTLARVVRFHRAVNTLTTASGPVRLAEVAAAHGYVDQAHLAREFTALGGLSPSQYRSRSAAGWGVVED